MLFILSLATNNMSAKLNAAFNTNPLVDCTLYQQHFIWDWNLTTTDFIRYLQKLKGLLELSFSIICSPKTECFFLGMWMKFD
jgi:hypothetical protein